MVFEEETSPLFCPEEGVVDQALTILIREYWPDYFNRIKV